MKAFAALLLGFAALALALPLVPAQEVKDDKKAVEKKDAEDKKGEEKKKVEQRKDAARYDEQTVLSRTKIVRGMVRSINPDGAEITITMIDAKKKAEYDLWKLKAAYDLKKNFKAGDIKDRLAKYQTDLQGKLDGVYSGDERIGTLIDGVRVRLSSPPEQLDKDGKPKKQLSVNQLAALKGPPGTRLPGYTGQLSAVKIGQVVDLYVMKLAPAPKAVAAAPKKGPIGQDPALTGGGGGPKEQVLMIHVLPDAN